jgi:hypothetical protein
MENGLFCSGCQTEADKNTSGCPDCGTVDQRLATGLYEFKDPKGRSPVQYVKVLEKLKLSVEEAMEEAGKLGVTLDAEHFEVVEKVKVKKTSKGRGRPMKAAGVIEADNVTDLFAKLTAEGNEEDIGSDDEKPASKKKAKLSEEEKAEKKAALEAERALKKAEREAKLAAEKAEREEKRKAELEQKKAERDAKLAGEKAEREEKRKAELEQKKAEREAKKEAEKSAKKGPKEPKEAKEAKEAAKKDTKEPKEAKAPKAKNQEKAEEPVKAASPAPAEEKASTKVTVKTVVINGVTYLKSSSNILYDPKSKEEVAVWNPVTKAVEDLPEEDDEEEEEDYESESD